VPVTDRWQAAIKRNVEHQQKLNLAGNAAAEAMVNRSSCGAGGVRRWQR
jgi:hypothetical protein